jgi:alkylation response protein AidB-like acyl-CoA dehydrogenase
MDGKTHVAVAHPINPHVNFAASADWVLAASGDALYLLPRDEITITTLKSVDPSRRVAAIEFDASSEHCLAEGEVGAALLRATLNRGGLASAAQLLGLSARLVEQSVQYTQDRIQFGRPVGANQAVKHLLADVAVQLEYARPVIARAAYTVGVSPERADFAVSHAKLAATRVASLAARQAIQAHGAMGYTWECDVHIAAKRIWALSSEWGDEGFHKNRIHEWLLQPNALLGPEFTFGRRSLVAG